MRIPVVGLVLALILLAGFPDASAQLQLTVGEASSSPGRLAHLPLDLSGGDVHAGLYAKVELPSGVSLEGLSRGSLLSPAFFLEHNPANRHIVVYAGSDQFTQGSGRLLYLHLRIPAGMAEGSYPVRLLDSSVGVLLADSDGMGTVRVQSLQPGSLIVTDQSGPIVTVSVEGDGQAFLDKDDYVLGDDAVATAVAAPGWVFVNWTEGIQVVSVEHEFSFQVVGDRSLQANFVPEQPGRWLVSIAPGPAEGGIVSGPTGTGMTNGGLHYGFFEPGVVVSVSAEAIGAWTFLDWFEAAERIGNGAPLFQFTVTNEAGHRYLTARMNPDEIFRDRFDARR